MFCGIRFDIEYEGRKLVRDQMEEINSSENEDLKTTGREKKKGEE